MKPYIHKTVLHNTRVYPKGKHPYMRSTYKSLCGLTGNQFKSGETMSPYDESTTCPECHELLHGRREGNKDVMKAAQEAADFNGIPRYH